MNLPFEETPTKSEATKPWIVEKSWMATEASHLSSISLTLIFFPLGAAAAAAGFAAVEVVVSFFAAAAGEVAASAFFAAAGEAASAGLDAGVSSTVADAFSSVVGGVDSGAGDSS